MDWAAAITGVLGGGALGSVVSWRALAFERKKWTAEQASHHRQRRIALLEEAIAVLDDSIAFLGAPKPFMQMTREPDRWRFGSAVIAGELGQQLHRVRSLDDDELTDRYEVAHAAHLAWCLEANEYMAGRAENQPGLGEVRQTAVDARAALERRLRET